MTSWEGGAVPRATALTMRRRPAPFLSSDRALRSLFVMGARYALEYFFGKLKAPSSTFCDMSDQRECGFQFQLDRKSEENWQLLLALASGIERELSNKVLTK